MNFRVLILPCIALLSVAVPTDSIAADLIGGRAILERIREEATEEESGTDPLEERRQILAELSPEEAAGQWLVWVDEFLAADQGNMFGSNNGFGQLLQVLPGPESWEFLKEKVAEREGEGLETLHLELLAAVLANDIDRQWEILLEIEGAVLAEASEPVGLGASNRYGTEVRLAAIGELMDAVGDTLDTPEKIRELLLRRLAHPSDSTYGYMGARAVPDLVTIFGEPEAREFIARLLEESSVPLVFRQGKATRELAREVVLEQVENLKAAPWGLIDSLDHVELYEALAEQFPRVESEFARNYDRQSAALYYAFGLAARGETEKAAAILEGLVDDSFYLPYDLAIELHGRPQRGRVQEFLETLLARDPDLPLWEAYFQVTGVGGDPESRMSFLEEMLESREWNVTARFRLQERLASGLLAADQVAAGVALLRDEARRALASDSLTEQAAWEVVSAGVTIARIGHLLENSEWQESGVDIAEEAGRSVGEGPGMLLAAYFEEVGDLARAQEIVVELLRAKVPEIMEDNWGAPSAATHLVNLARLFHAAGKPEEVLFLVHEAPWWGTKDLAEIIRETGSGDEPIGFLVASALVETGQADRAIPVLQALLLSGGGYDPAYELLVDIDPDGAVAFFDRLLELDPFEERPLIWQATLYRERGLLQEAKDLVERAIAVDPSDGEQGVGDRMRAYQVLSNVLVDLGNEEQAAFYAEVVASIRMSEEADALYAVGLRDRAIRLYEEALTHFSDAYCIQARMAKQLQEMGQYEEAQAHYRRAFELMPESFGRVESHCFGCEAIFAGEQAQSTAERIFAEFREERPEQPQVWYLSGYLNYERGKYADAAAQFLRAVELDPDYLNAWSKIAAIGQRIHLDREVRDRAALAILRLDPLGRHVTASLSGVSDLRKLWNAVENAVERQPEQPDELVEFSATIDFLDQLPGDRMVGSTWQRFVAGNPAHPAAALANHDLLNSLASSLEAVKIP